MSAYSLHASLSHLLHRAQQFAADRFGAGASDLTQRQFALLAAVAEEAGQTQTDLVRATGIDRSTLADMIGRMEDRGYVSRDKAEADKRAKSVTLTSAGKRALEAAIPSAQSADAAVMEAIAKNKQSSFLETLRGIARAAEAAASEPAPAPAAPPRRGRKPAAKAAAPKRAPKKPGPKPKAKAKPAAVKTKTPARKPVKRGRK